MNIATINDFQKIEMRVGKIVEVADFPEARKPAYKLTIDFGPTIGTKKSSAQITNYYKKEDLLNTLVICVTNFPPRQIGPFVSEVLTMGVPAQDNSVILIRPDHDVPLGGQVF